MTLRILLIEDEEEIADFVVRGLRRDEWLTIVFMCGWFRDNRDGEIPATMTTA